MFLLVLASVVTGLYVSHTCCRQRKPRRPIPREFASEYKDL